MTYTRFILRRESLRGKKSDFMDCSFKSMCAEGRANIWGIHHIC